LYDLHRLMDDWRAKGRSALPASGVGRRVLRGLSWTVVGNAVASLSSLVGSVLVARMLGARHFGEFGIIQSTFVFFVLLVGTSLGVTATKYVAELRGTDTARTGRVLKLITFVTYALSITAALVVLFGAPFIANVVLKAPHITAGVRLAALALLLASINGLQVGVLAGFEAFKEAAVANIARGVMALPTMLLGAHYLGYLGAVWALVAGWGAACIVSNIYIRRVSKRHGVSLKAPGFWKERRVLVGFALPATVGSLAVALANWVTCVIMTRQPDGLQQMGIFNFVNQGYQLLMFVPMMVGQTSMPILAERIAAHDSQTTVRTVKRLFMLNESLIWPFVLVLSLLSGHIMHFAGGDYAGQWLVLVITMVTVPLYAESRMASSVIMAYDKTWLICWASLLYFAVFIGMELLLAARGVLGLSVARFTAYAVYSGFTIWVAYSLLRRKGAREDAAQ